MVIYTIRRFLEGKNGRNTSEIKRFLEHSRVHISRLKNGDRQRQMAALSLTTIIGVAEYGKSRADHIFVD